MESKTSYVSAKDMIINAPTPVQTRTYKPVTHAQLIDLTLNSLHGAGFTLEEEVYTSAKDGKVANGRYVISNVADSEMKLQIGWQNSYDKSLSLKFAIGARIFICQNGCVSGDHGAFRRKHLGTIQEFTPAAITDYIKSSGESFRRLQMDREKMKQIEITKRTTAELIGRMIIEEQIIESTQMNIIESELRNPTHNYGAPGSMWELYQFTTYAMKQIHPSLWMDRHIKAHNFFVNESGVLVMPNELSVPPVAQTAMIMAQAGDSQDDIEKFTQLSFDL